MPLFVNETHVTRALAAEIRHAPDASRRFIETIIGADLPSLSGVSVEEKRYGKVDVRAQFGTISVGLEGKIAHELGLAQVEREIASLDYLILVVDELGDVRRGLPAGVFVTTWVCLLSMFDSPRLRIDDISELAESTKLTMRRKLEAAVRNTAHPLLASHEEAPTARGFPSITLKSFLMPKLFDSQLMAQLQNVGSGYFQTTLGIVTDAPDVNDRPSWVAAMLVCGPRIEQLVGEGPFEIEFAATGKAERKQLALQNGLPLWHAKGYTDYVGIKTVKSEDYVGLLDETIRWVVQMSEEMGATSAPAVRR
jgi:hypothetical protein